MKACIDYRGGYSDHMHMVLSLMEGNLREHPLPRRPKSASHPHLVEISLLPSAQYTMCKVDEIIPM